MSTNSLAVAPNTNTDTVSAPTLARVIDEHKTALMRYVLRLTFGDIHLAEDIVQETLLRMWQRPGALTSHHTSIRPWLYTVARNLVRDRRRARKARPSEVYDTEVDHKPTEASEIDNAITAHDMKQALAHLSPDHRAVLVEVYYRDRQLGEAAEALGVPLGTVKSRVYYALRALRQIVNELGIADRPSARPQAA